MFKTVGYLNFRSPKSVQYSNQLSMSLTDMQISIQKTAEEAAIKAGEYLISGLGKINLQLDIKSKIGDRDIVTEVDKNAQDVIKMTILKAFPDHDFLGEEDVEPGIEASMKSIAAKSSSDFLWIVDPLDGTTNFAHGIPLSGVIIALACKGEIEFGLIYDPYRNEIFTAWKGKGAYLNGRVIHCCNTNSLKSSVICSGSPPNIKSLEACLRAMNDLSPKVRTMRLFGSAATMLSWVAVGRCTAYFEADLNVWDLAAGALLIQEAGGVVTDVHGETFKLQTRNLVASNGLIHEELLKELQSSKMWIINDE